MRDWWQEKAFGLLRNDWAWIGAGILLAFLFSMFPIDWNAVFGQR